MANLTGSGIIIPSILDPSILDYVHKNADVPVIYVGMVPPKYVPYYTFYDLETLKRIVGSEAIVKAVAKMYNVDIPEDLMRRIKSIAVDKKAFENILVTMVSLGVITEEILDRGSRFA